MASFSRLRWIADSLFPTTAYYMKMSSRDEKLQDFLESLGSPAVLVGRDFTILFCNSRLCKMFSKFSHDLVGLKIGEALDCAYATYDSHCGENALCLQCRIRRLVALARITGEGINEVPISFLHKFGLNQTYKITTERKGDVVLLMIEAGAHTSPQGG
jgi:PAS domain-containing protein